MAKPDPERLAAALRDNLRRRKAQMRATASAPSFGTDEEGDVVMPLDGAEHPGAWVTESSEKA